MARTTEMPPSATLDSRAENFVKEFTLHQLRELVGTVSLGKEIGSLQGKSRQELIDLLGRTGDAKQKALVAHKLETITPYKHLYLYAPAKEIEYKALASDWRRRFASIIDNFSPLPREATAELHLQLCLIDDQSRRIFLKFAHQVNTWETVKTSGNRRVQQLFKRRHPVVIAVYCSLRLVVVSFPGFTQSGVGYKDRFNYAGIANDAARLLTEKSGLELTGFQAKNAIEKLLADPDSQVVDVKRSIKPQGGGRIVVDSWEDRSDLAQYLAKFFHGEGNLSVDPQGVRKLLQEGSVDDIWLMWLKFDLLTRFAFQQPVPEVLVVWRGAGPDLSKVEFTLQELATHLSAAMPSDTLAAVQEIEGVPTGNIVTPNGLAQRFNLSTDEALRVLMGAASRGHVEMRFRVRTSAILHEFENRWRRNLVEFPTQVVDEDGNVLDLADRSNLEVAFEKVG